MQHTEGAAAVRPDEHQSVLSLGHRGQGFLHVGRALHGMTIHLHDHVSALQAGVVGGAAGLHLLDNRAVEIRRRLQLLTQLRSHVGKSDAPAWLAIAVAGNFGAVFVAAAHQFQRYRNVHVLAVTQNIELDARSGLLLPDFDLKLAGIAYFLTVQFGDDIPNFQAGLRCRGVIFNLRDHRAFIVVDVEELGILRGHVADADSHVSVADLAVTNESLHRGADDLRWNGKTHTREAVRVRNQERVDSDHFPACIYQRTAGVARVDGCVRLNKASGRASISRKRVRPVQTAHDATRYREAESEGIAES